MHYQIELDIALPREQVIDMFLDSQNLPKWQPDLVSFEAMDGSEEREVGAKSRQIHKMGRREVEIIETITVHNFPDEFSATYESEGVWNLIKNRFVDVDEQTTRWVLDCECKVSGIITKLIAFFIPGMFKRPTVTMMNRFKEFAENPASI